VLAEGGSLEEAFAAEVELTQRTYSVVQAAK
jgi:hypothetical protein